MTDELRSVADVARWLDAGLALRRIVPPEPAGDGAPGGEPDHARVAHAIAACANELAALPPPGVIADLATLLIGGRPALSAGLAGGDDGVRRALRAYDDDVVARLIATPRFDDVLAAYAHTAAADRAAAVALVVAALCERAGFAGVAVSPGALRRALARRIDGGGGDDAVAPGTALVDQLADAYHRLARGARLCRALVDERDAFAIDHLAVLRDLGGRMTAAHIAAAAAAITERLPRRLPARRALRGQHDTSFADDTLYPAGGFASITPGGATTGNIENLVTSELVYIDDDEPVSPTGEDPRPAGTAVGVPTPRDSAPPIDVFSLRYVEGELLHYTRDDSVFRRHRHVIGIVLGPDLDGARVKDRGLPWQRVILALGLVVAAIRWLVERLGDQALAVHVAFPPEVLAEERDIVALLLEGEVARGTVAIVAKPWHETIALVAGAAGAIADLVVVSLGATPALPHQVRALHVDLSGVAPAIRDLAPRTAVAPAEPLHDPWTGWCDAAEDLLRWLV